MKKNVLVIITLSILFSGCGSIDRTMAQYTGKGSETCQDGVIYLQFTSGTTVKYNQDSTVATCKK
jgi:uncharacterized protein YceK